MLDVFYFIWSIFDITFRAIETTTNALFPYIPESAVSLVISVIFYSIIAMFEYLSLKTDSGTKSLIMGLLKKISITIAVLIVIWRFGVITMLSSTIDVSITISEFVISIIYVGVFGLIIVAFFIAESSKMQKIVLFLTWFLLILITIFIAPITNELPITENTIPQLLILAFVFAVPNALSYKEHRNKNSD